MQPAVPAVRLVRREAGRADARDDRRPADGEGRRLGLVRRRLVERGRRRRRARAGRTATGRRAPTRTTTRVHVSEVPGQRLPVPPPTVHLLLELRPGDAGPRRTCATSRSSSQTPWARSRRCQIEAGELRQAARRGERAPRLRERAERQRPPRPPAAVHRGDRVREGHDGDRHLRRVRRRVGPRHAARDGRWAAGRTTSRPGHADPGARSRRSCRRLRRRPAPQHDTTSILVDDRAPLRARPADRAATRRRTTCRACGRRRRRARRSQLR